MKTIDILIPAYNAAAHLADCLNAIQNQSGFAQWVGQVIVVDDGSSDDTQNVLQALQCEQLVVVTHPQNRGRSAAINTAAQHAQSPYLLLLDADCRIAGTDWLAVFYQEAAQAGKKIVFGMTCAESNTGFWERYTNQVAHERIASGQLLKQALTNVLIARDLFEQAGGFSEDFTHYGFEDKDLLLRLGRFLSPADMAFREDLIVLHSLGGMRVATVCNKFRESGQYTGPVFERRNPEAYRRLPYARCDARLIAWPLKLTLNVLSLFFPLLLGVSETLVKWRGVPYALQLLGVRVCLLLTYFQGSRKATS